MASRPTILFVAMHTSIHVARWIEMTSHRRWPLHLFPVLPGPTNENLSGVTLHWPCVHDDSAEAASDGEAWSSLRQGTRRGFRVARLHPTIDELGGEEALEAGGIRLGESDQRAPLFFGPGILASVIRRLRPDLIHSLEFQHAGYLVLRAKELYGAGFPPWLATNFGSDIYHFRRFPDHNHQIRRLLANIDLYSCECSRDIEQARALGYTGPTLPVLPNSGGFDIGHVEVLHSGERPSQRRLLVIKGYEHFAGRAMIALKVLETFSAQLKDYEIILYSVGEAPYQFAKELIAQGILNIKIVGYATHDEMLSYFGRSRIYMGISLSDAISTSVLEAMAMGAFPIQTNTSCCDEWYVDGEGGFIVPPDDFDLICQRFARALEDDDLVDRAAEVNWATVKKRLDAHVMRQRVEEFYDQGFATLRSRAMKNAGRDAA